MTGPSQRPRDSQVAEAGAKPCLWFLGWGLLLWSFISSSPSPRELQTPLHTAGWSVSKILTGSSPSPQPSGYGLRQGSGLCCCPLAGLISFPHPTLASSVINRGPSAGQAGTPSRLSPSARITSPSSSPAYLLPALLQQTSVTGVVTGRLADSPLLACAHPCLGTFL